MICPKCQKPKFGPSTTICTADTMDPKFQERWCRCGVTFISSGANSEPKAAQGPPHKVSHILGKYLNTMVADLRIDGKGQYLRDLFWRYERELEAASRTSGGTPLPLCADCGQPMNPIFQCSKCGSISGLATPAAEPTKPWKLASDSECIHCGLVTGPNRTIASGMLRYCPQHADGHVFKLPKAAAEPTVTIKNPTMISHGDYCHFDYEPCSICKAAAEPATVVGPIEEIGRRALEAEPTKARCTRDPNTCKVDYCAWPNCSIPPMPTKEKP